MAFPGGLGQTRTADLVLTKHVHCQLCYETIMGRALTWHTLAAPANETVPLLAGDEGFEPSHRITGLTR